LDPAATFECLLGLCVSSRIRRRASPSIACCCCGSGASTGGTSSAIISPACPKGGTPAMKCQSKPAVRTTRTKASYNRKVDLKDLVVDS